MRIVVPGCGQELRSVKVMTYTGTMPETVLWEVKSPAGASAAEGNVVLGDDSAFGVVVTPLASPLPDVVLVDLSFSKGYSSYVVRTARIPKSAPEAGEFWQFDPDRRTYTARTERQLAEALCGRS